MKRLADDRQVASTEANGHRISTVKLTTPEQDYTLPSPPLWFETMVFCRHGAICEWDQAQERYATQHEAEVGHFAMVKKVREEHGTSTQP